VESLWAETDEPLYNALLFSGSKSDEADIKFTTFFLTDVTKPHSFILVTVERADGVAVHDVHTAIYTSPSE
jgi:hypothetical protein